MANKNSITIGTHDGPFHCDDALACYLLKILHPEATIKRSRDSLLLDACDIVVDVGAVYDPEKNRFDHHQKSFSECMSTIHPEINSEIKLSAAGLIYAHFGKSILKKILPDLEAVKLEYLFKTMYTMLIREIDAIDNGIPAFEGEPCYTISSSISSRVGRLNKAWNNINEKWDSSAQFEKAMALVGQEFEEQLSRLSNEEYPARMVVASAFENRNNVHSSGEIIELPVYCPWKNILFDLENDFNMKSKIKYVVFESDTDYRIACVPITPKSFKSRKPLPLEWRGLRDLDLSNIAHIDDCIFVHATGFIGGHRTRDGALKMAIKALENADPV